MYPQFYHTRCAAEQSVIGQAGFTVRGSSITAEEVIAKKYHQSLVQLAAYELPHDQLQTALAGNLGTEEAPVRLARIKLDDGFALVHSVFRPDAGERKVNYFSHAALMPAENSLSAAQCLQTWGISGSFGGEQGWVWQDQPDPASTGGAALPSWTPNASEAKTHLQPEAGIDFLRGEAIAVSDKHASLAVFPDRLQGETHLADRRHLIECLLAIYLSQQQVVLVGEPGLAVLLMYTITQLLPNTLLRDLTFSTYESITRCTEQQLDITNTVCEGTQGQPTVPEITDPNVLLLNTFAPPHLKSFNVTDSCKTYAQRAVEYLSNGQTDMLSEFWKLAMSFAEEHTLTRTTFLDAWNKWHRVRGNPFECNLSEDEVCDYLTDARTRHLLFQFDAGQHLAVDYVLKQDTPWWPSDPGALKTDPTFSSTSIRKLVTLLVKQTVAALESDHDPKYEITNKCLNTLLPGLVGKEQAIQHFLNVLKSENYDPADKLAWSSRRHLLNMLADAHSNMAGHDTGALRIAQEWFEFSDEKDLINLLQMDNIPREWKSKATTLWIFKRNSYTKQLARLFRANPPLLYESLTYISEKEKKASDTIITNIFHALDKQDFQIEFCKHLLSSPWVSQHPNFRQGLVNCLISLYESNIQWETFFGDESSGFLSLANKNVDVVVEILSLLCQQLKPSCMRADNTMHAMLKSLLQIHDQLAASPSSTNIEKRRLRDDLIISLEHWKVIYDATYNLSPNDDSWARLRWAIYAIHFDEPVLLMGLISRLKPVDESRLDVDYLEIANCAEAMTGRDNLIASSKLLITAVNQISQKSFSQGIKGKILARLMESLCRDGEWISQMMYQIKLGLGQDGVTFPPIAERHINVRRNVLRHKARGKKDLWTLFVSLRLSCTLVLFTLAAALIWKLKPQLISPWISQSQMIMCLLIISLSLNIVQGLIRYLHRSK